jgi:hypothetical protein
MKRCRAVFLAFAALELVAYSTCAAEYPAASFPVQPNNLQPGPPVAAANTNQVWPQVGASELRIQFRLLSALAQEHRQRAEAATRSDQAQRAKWETEVAEELGNRGSNILVQLGEIAPPRQALLGGVPPEAAGPLSPAEADYLAKIEERLQAVQQEIAAATEETTSYALQAATNRDTIEYGYNSISMRIQAASSDLRRLQAEQAELDLRTSQFWALRAMVRNAHNVPAAEPKSGAANAPLPENGK